MLLLNKSIFASGLRYLDPHCISSHTTQICSKNLNVLSAWHKLCYLKFNSWTSRHFIPKAFQHALTEHTLWPPKRTYKHIAGTQVAFIVFQWKGASIHCDWASPLKRGTVTRSAQICSVQICWEAGLANLQGHNSKGASGEPLLCQKRGKAAQLLRHRLAFWSVHKLQSETEAFFDANGRSSKAVPKNISFFGTVMGLALVLGNHTAKDCVKCPLRVLKSSRLHRCGHCTCLPATISESHTLAIKGLRFKLLGVQCWTTHC